MGPLNVVFDTNILIDYLKGFPAATKEIDLYPGALISIVTWIEILAGARPLEENTVRRLLFTFECIELDSEIAERAAEIRRHSKLKLPDATILATARVHHATLVTRDAGYLLLGNIPDIRVPYRL